MMTLTAPSITLIPPMSHVRTALGDDAGEERRRARRAAQRRDARRTYAEFHDAQHDRGRPELRRPRPLRDGRALS
jgi:hypothetical protein